MVNNVLAFVFVLLCASGCTSAGDGDRRGSMTPRRDINLVKEEHAGELMSLPGVVGVYVGALEDGKPCIGVMVVRKTRELEQKIPGTLEGYPVRIDETGEIKPMK
jgi:hypothetical protein